MKKIIYILLFLILCSFAVTIPIGATFTQQQLDNQNEESIRENIVYDKKQLIGYLADKDLIFKGF